MLNNLLVAELAVDEPLSFENALGIAEADNVANAQKIMYGDSVTGTIDPIGDLDCYTFDGAAGDIIFLQLSDPSRFLDAKFRLYNPDNSLAIEVEGSGSLNALLEDSTLTQDGTYKLVISDVDANETGSYNFTIESINNPGDSVEIKYGDSITSAVDVTSDLDHYTFEGTAGDIIFLQLSDPSRFLDAKFRLYNPDNSLAIEVEGSGSLNALLEDSTLTQDGTYKLVISDVDANETGSYNFTIESINNPEDSVEIKYGDSITSAVDVTSDLDHYTFEGTAGDIISLQLSDPSRFLDAKFRLYNPDNSLAIEVEGSGSLNALLEDSTLTQDGTYKLVISDVDANETGNYNFTIESINNPGDSVEIKYGDSITSAVDVTSDLDHYTFEGTAGDIISLQLSDPSRFLDAKFRLYSPNNLLLTEVEGSGSLNALLEDFTLAQTGIYKIMVSDVDANETGDYTLSLNGIINPPPVAPPLTDCLPTIVGTENDDILAGTSEDDAIAGLAGDDFLTGHWGDDCLQGGDGDDEIRGNWGDDHLKGDAGFDLLIGNWGDDLLEGGAGDDLLRGGHGSDRFVLNIGEGLDTILDYQDGQDQFVLQDSLSFGQLTVAQQNNNVLLSLTSTGEQLGLINNANVTEIGVEDFVFV